MTTVLSGNEEQALLDLFIDHQAYGLGVQSLRSGRILPVCPDPRLLISNPHALQYCGHVLAQQFSLFTFDTVCAMATAAIPFATIAAIEAQVPFTYVFPTPRPARNTLRGTYELEGQIPQQAQLLIIDDASGWGLTKLPVLQRLLDQEWRIRGVLSVVELQSQYDPWYAKHCIPCYALSSARTLLERLWERDLVSQELYQRAVAWFASPTQWTADMEVGRSFLACCSQQGVLPNANLSSLTSL